MQRLTTPLFTFVAVVLVRLLSVGTTITASTLAAQSTTNVGTTISGVVFDSIASRPLREALVQIVGAASPVLGQQFHASSDSAGRFVIRGVPHGDYAAGFVHPRLDSLGIESEPTAVTVGSQPVTLDLATPSAATFVRLVCPDQPAEGLLVGHVRASGTGAPLAGAAVSATWSEIDTSSVVAIPRSRERSISTSPSGWFALCGLPRETSVLVRGGSGTDSSGYVRLTMTDNPVAVATFHVGGATRIASTTAGVAATWNGTARLTGIVRDARGEPMPNAQLSVWGTTAETATDARGRFQLGDLPAGTQSLEVRAIGYQPVVQTMHLDASTSLTEDIVLSDRVTELEGVTVTANAARARLAPFYERMKDSERGINHGYFITPEDMEQRRPSLITNMLEGMPGIRIERFENSNDPKNVVVRGAIRETGGYCQMTVYMDGIRIAGPGGGGHESSINLLIDPATVSAIEVYPRPVSAPPRYQSLNGTCGVVLIWTK